MIDFLRDPVWQFVGVILAIVALVATIIIHLLQRKQKILSWEFISINKLLTVREELEGKLQVFYDGSPARDIRLLLLKLINTGNVAISASDFERPISFKTGASSRILSAVATEVSPSHLEVEVSNADTRATVKPVLLNPGDFITLKILVHDFETVSVDGRVIGVKEVLNLNVVSWYQLFASTTSAVCAVAGFYLVMKYAPKLEYVPPLPPQVHFGFGLIAFYFIRTIMMAFKSSTIATFLNRARKNMRRSPGQVL
jgi:hypothetical protein